MHPRGDDVAHPALQGFERHVQSLGGNVADVGHPDDEQTADVVGEGGDVDRGVVIASLAGRNVTLVVQVLGFAGVGIADQVGDLLVGEQVQRGPEQGLQPAGTVQHGYAVSFDHGCDANGRGAGVGSPIVRMRKIVTY
ncbi:hypothetical protein OG320_10825 [Microbispora sp. NBC_01189]|uniref:hypothetical protein n=1 Tax=Microbispora sp. NBC_01189 TaxID=2903583 RepID=UPI002E122606|nr:hypothetical protein OG320_10825 [Microbispora sp. NBC_01189]